jgi:hypothetical protein
MEDMMDNESQNTDDNIQRVQVDYFGTVKSSEEEASRFLSSDQPKSEE